MPAEFKCGAPADVDVTSAVGVVAKRVLTVLIPCDYWPVLSRGSLLHSLSGRD